MKVLEIRRERSYDNSNWGDYGQRLVAVLAAVEWPPARMWQLKEEIRSCFITARSDNNDT